MESDNVTAYLHCKTTCPVKPFAVLHVRFEDVQRVVHKVDQRPFIHLPIPDPGRQQERRPRQQDRKQRSPRRIPRRSENGVH